MAKGELFSNSDQVKAYAGYRPSYPPSLFEKLAAVTERHERVWDVGTGNGQAAVMLAEHYKSVVATDVSEEQLSYAISRPNVTYAHLSAAPSAEEVERIVGSEGSVDLVTVATALHYFDFEKFYPIVKHVLRKPGGVFAAWTYLWSRTNIPELDRVMEKFNRIFHTYNRLETEYVVQEYRTIPFPFDPLVTGGRNDNEPEIIEAEAAMDFDGYLGLQKSTSSIQNALDQGVDLLNDDFQREILEAWGPRDKVHTFKFPLYLRMGKIGSPNVPPN